MEPAFLSLSGSGFEGARAEFLEAHRFFVDDQFGAALTQANCAFESTMKSICAQKGWSCKDKDSSGRLIEICKENGLFEGWHLDHAARVAKLLQGVSVVRNKNGSHGVGVAPKAIPKHVARLGLNLAATNIAFLVQAYKG